MVHHQGFEQLSKSESIEKWRFDTLPDSSVSTSVSILVDAAEGAYMVENYILNEWRDSNKIMINQLLYMCMIKGKSHD